MIYQNEYLREILFPIGGIGTGSVSIAGNGRLCDWEIFNRPAKGSINGYSHIAVCAKSNGKVYPKVLNGDHNKDFVGQYSKKTFSGYGFGPAPEMMCGFPHFQNIVFDGQFPIAKLTFTDKDFPGNITLTAFNPLIPGDAENSSIPAAFFDLTYENNTDSEVELIGALSVKNPFNSSKNEANKNSVTMYHAGIEKTNVNYGDITIAVDAESCGSQEYWYRGGWQDGIVMFWNELSKGYLSKRHYNAPSENDTASVYGNITVKPGEKKNIRFVMSWNIPNNYNYWEPALDEKGNNITWKNYYATRYNSSVESAEYALESFTSLFERTEKFREALFSQTLDESVIDAVASTLSVLKSPTVLRLENGEFYGWEGVNEENGSCEGTCQHVWNYAYALCFLFPELERSIHELELKYCLNPDGGMPFRLKLPLGYRENTHRPCLDGQMGTVIKFYRDWKISGNTEELKSKWSAIKRIMAFTWSESNPDRWDRDMDGVLEGRQHHTLDMELFGPHAWLEGFYLTALRACSEMASELGDPDEKVYNELYENGYKWTRENLFNGKYFIQKIDLSDKSVIDKYENTEKYWNEETKQIKYQIANGCEIDQLCGQWHASINGLGYVFNKEQIHTALSSLFKNNYKSTIRNFTNPWRNFALNDEAATVICDYPEGSEKPSIPIPYCEEAMNGFEYQLAGMLISEGFTEEGLKVVRGVRDRYNGKNRNPFNEMECGSNYARSMASFALIPIFSGFYFYMPHNCIGFDPKLKGDFRSFWSLECGYGIFEKTDSTVKISVIEGSLPIASLKLPFIKKINTLMIDGKGMNFELSDGYITFEKTAISKEIMIIT